MSPPPAKPILGGPDAGVSEVVGSILMVAITVAAAGAMFGVVYGSIPSGEGPQRASFAASVQANDGGWGTGDETVTVVHEGGHALHVGAFAIVVEVAGTETRFAQSEGEPLDHADESAFTAEDRRFTIGERWRSTGLTIPATTPVAIRTVDDTSSDVIWEADLRSTVDACDADEEGPRVSAWSQGPDDVTTATSGEVNVTATLSDDCQVDETVDPHLHYRVNDGTNPPFTDGGAMARGTGTTWEATIPDQGWGNLGGRTLEYKLVGMQDVSGNEATSTVQRDVLQTLSYVQTPLGMVVGTAENDANARSATDGGAAATLTEGEGTTTAELSADAVVGTSAFTPASEALTLDGVFADATHTAAVITGSDDQTMRKLTLGGSQVWSHAHTRKVLGVDLGPDGNAYLGDDGNLVRKVDPSGTTVWDFTGHGNKVHEVAVDRDGYVYSASEDNTVRKISPTGTQEWSFTGHTSKVFSVAVDAEGYVYSASEDNTVRKISPTGSEVWSFTGHTSKVLAVAVGDDGYVYSGSEDGTLRKISATGSEVWSFTGHTNKVHGVAVDAEGYVYSASEDNTVRKISATGSEVWSFTGHASTVFDVAVDDDLRAIRVGFQDQSALGPITKVEIRAHVKASADSNEWRLEGCLSGGCTGTSPARVVGTSAETISYDVTDQHPDGSSWTWSDVNDLEGIVTARATQAAATDLAVDHVWLVVNSEEGFALETDSWTFDALGEGSTKTLELRYATDGTETYELQIWDGSAWVTQSPALDQGSRTTITQELTDEELSAGPQVRLIDQDTAPDTRGSLDVDYARVVSS